MTLTTPTTATPDTTPNTPASFWLDDVLAAIDVLQGGALDRLTHLAHNPPTNPTEIFPAITSLIAKLNMGHVQPSQLIDVALNRGESTMFNQIGAAKTAFVRLFENLLKKANELLDNGMNYDADPVVRTKDFGERGTQVVGDSPLLQRRFGYVERLPPSHPFRKIEPMLGNPLLGVSTPVLALGPPDAPYYRLSAVKALTAEEVFKLAEEERREKRLADERREADQRRYRESPAGQKELIERLEREIAQLKAERATA